MWWLKTVVVLWSCNSFFVKCDLFVVWCKTFKSWWLFCGRVTLMDVAGYILCCRWMAALGWPSLQSACYVWQLSWVWWIADRSRCMKIRRSFTSNISVAYGNHSMMSNQVSAVYTFADVKHCHYHSFYGICSRHLVGPVYFNSASYWILWRLSTVVCGTLPVEICRLWTTYI